jgi:asparagine synthase (glutamine-hydrolysing)
MKFTLADNDLPKVLRTTELAGVGVAFPFLNDNVVAYSTLLPPKHKVNGTKLRYFIKKALKDFLPQETITKEKQGFGLPFGVWLTTHKPLKELAIDNLNDLKKREIVKTQFIDELINTHLNSHATNYGTMVWVFLMLEQWFKNHPK